MNRVDSLEDGLEELKTKVNDLEAENLENIQENNFAFKFQITSSTNKVKQGKIVKFDKPIHGTGIEDGVFTAPIGNNL